MSATKVLEVWELPISMGEFAAAAKRVTDANPGQKLLTKQVGQSLICFAPGDHDATQCWCHHCDDLVRQQVYDITKDGMQLAQRFMIVCPICGNKRCPHASHHERQCSGSNEPGQTGSVYAEHG